MHSFTSLILVAILLSIVPQTYGLKRAKTQVRRQGAGSTKKERFLKKSKKSKSEVQMLEATIEGEKDDDDDQEFGTVTVKFEDGGMAMVSYALADLPEECEDCYMAIYDGDECSDMGDPLWDTDEWSSDTKWEEEGKIGTNLDGEAAGAMFGIDSGLSYDENKCKPLVVFDGDGDEIGCGMLEPEDGC